MVVPLLVVVQEQENKVMMGVLFQDSLFREDLADEVLVFWVLPTVSIERVSARSRTSFAMYDIFISITLPFHTNQRQKMCEKGLKTLNLHSFCTCFFFESCVDQLLQANHHTYTIIIEKAHCHYIIIIFFILT